MEDFSNIQNVNWQDAWNPDNTVIDSATKMIEDYYFKFNSMLNPEERISLGSKTSGYNMESFVAKKTIIKQDSFPFHKPDAHWSSYGFKQFTNDIGWIDWAIYEMPTMVLPWERDVFAISLISDESRILKLDTSDKIINFTIRYGVESFGRKEYPIEINWKKVQDAGYWAIDISPHQPELRYKISWYCTWDCASQAIWNYRAIKSIRKLN